MPVVVAVSIPDGDTEATVILLLLQTPPPGEQLSSTVAPWHIMPGPVIAVGIAATFITPATAQPVANV